MLVTTPVVSHTVCAPAHVNERCGYISVPLDRRDPGGRQIQIYFEQYLRRETAKPATSTVVSIEGGPGYSTTADRSSRIPLWKPVNKRRDLILIDLRGTGKSGALACQAFQRHNTGYAARAGRCAQQLGPARDFYDTSQSVQDIQAVLVALHVGKIDLYGDSYGSYASQAFALRYPHRLRTLTLDGTYPLPGTDPDFTDLAAASRSAIRLACRRGPLCPVRGEDPVVFVQRFVDRITASPISGMTTDADGAPVEATVTPSHLAEAITFGGDNPSIWRDLLGAIASANHGDNAAILRIVAENITTDFGNGPARESSEALYLSVICHDYPQPWSPQTPMADRLAVALAGVDSRPQSLFAPFTGRVWTGIDYEGAFACLDWPSPAFPDPPNPPGAKYPDVPTLVLNGDLDNITPLMDAREVAARFPRSTLVVVRNVVHVTAIGDQNHCASVIYERFVSTRSPGNTSCAARVPELHTVGRYPLKLAQVAQARPVAGDRSTLGERRMAAAGAATVADSLADWWANFSGVGKGLRGGRWSYSGSNTTTFRFTKTVLVPGVSVTGTTRWVYSTGAVTVNVTVRAGGTALPLRMTWSLNDRLGRASITGTSGGRPLRLTMLAP